MRDEHCPTLARANTLTVKQAADLAEIAFALGLASQAQFFIDVAFTLADGGRLIAEDVQLAIDLLRITVSKESASKANDCQLTEGHINLIGIYYTIIFGKITQKL